LQRFDDRVVPLFAELDILLIEESDLCLLREALDVSNPLRQIFEKLFEERVVVGA